MALKTGHFSLISATGHERSLKKMETKTGESHPSDMEKSIWLQCIENPLRKGDGKCREELQGRGDLLQKHLSREGATVMGTRPNTGWCFLDTGQTEEDLSLQGAIGVSVPMLTSPVKSAQDTHTHSFALVSAMAQAFYGRKSGTRQKN